MIQTSSYFAVRCAGAENTTEDHWSAYNHLPGVRYFAPLQLVISLSKAPPLYPFLHRQNKEKPPQMERKRERDGMRKRASEREWVMSAALNNKGKSSYWEACAVETLITHRGNGTGGHAQTKTFSHLSGDCVMQNSSNSKQKCELCFLNI